MEDKIGLPLEEIHLRGDVPQCELLPILRSHSSLTRNMLPLETDKEKLHFSLARFFQKLAVDKPVLRNNYFFQIIDPELATDPSEVDPDELAWSYTTNGDEDMFNQATKEPFPDLLVQPVLTAPSVAGPDTPTTDDEFPPPIPSPQTTGAGVEKVIDSSGRERAKFVLPQPTTSVSYIRFRTERQSLRRLPRTGAIVFTIRTYLFPIEELAKEPGVPGRMASAIRSWPEDVMTCVSGFTFS